MRGWRLGIAIAALAAAFAVPAGAATAGGFLSGPLASLADCGYGSESQVFRPWLDLAQYSLAPQGDLASTSDWTLAGASVSNAHDPFGLSARSLVFDANGDTAVTPTMCVNLQNPTLRFVVAGSGYVDVVMRYVGLDGAVHRAQLARVPAGRAWAPSPLIVLGVNALSVLSWNGSTSVSFELRAGGLAPGQTLSADGIWVDPSRSV